MAERLADVSAQISNVRQLEGVITAMRGIAASRAQQARALIAGVDAHASIAAKAISRAMALPQRDLPASALRRQHKRLVIVFCAEQGFAGAFSRRVIEAAQIRSDDLVFVIGARGWLTAEEAGVRVDLRKSMVTRAVGVSGLANDVADAIYAAVDSGRVSGVTVVFPTVADGAVVVAQETLVPLDLARFGAANELGAPITTLAPETLLERLAAEYVFARLCRAALRALEAENQARMLAMAAARTNVETKLEQLVRLERRLRQEDITTEIIEVAAGAARSVN